MADGAVNDETASVFDEKADRSGANAPPLPPTGVERYQGGAIFDSRCRVAYMSPAAEEFLGWRNEAVVGMSCQSIFDCRDTIGESLCTRCGLKASLERQEDVPGMVARVRDSSGWRHDVNTTFLYLDPARYGWQPRVIGVFRGLGSLPHQLPPYSPAPEGQSVKSPAP